MSGSYFNLWNPYLYNQLSREFGDVVVAHEGESLYGRSIRNNSGELGFHILHPGETYRINCCFCGIRKSWDSRHRLYINHRWGMPDENGRPDWRLAKCYNENCLAIPEYRNQLRSRIYRGLGNEQRGRLPLMQGVTEPAGLGPVSWPGQVIPLDQLPLSHPANLYLTSRKFDPRQMAAAYRLVYCAQADPEYAQAQNRIIIPVFTNGGMVGWQARHIGETDWRGMAKYYTRPGFHKRLTFYNFDMARRQRLAIIVEGVTDCWAVGDCGMALLGKTISKQQVDILTLNWAKWHDHFAVGSGCDRRVADDAGSFAGGFAWSRVAGAIADRG